MKFTNNKNLRLMLLASMILSCGCTKTSGMETVETRVNKNINGFRSRVDSDIEGFEKRHPLAAQANREMRTIHEDLSSIDLAKMSRAERDRFYKLTDEERKKFNAWKSKQKHELEQFRKKYPDILTESERRELNRWKDETNAKFAEAQDEAKKGIRKFREKIDILNLTANQKRKFRAWKQEQQKKLAMFKKDHPHLLTSEERADIEKWRLEAADDIKKETTRLHNQFVDWKKSHPDYIKSK